MSNRNSNIPNLQKKKKKCKKKKNESKSTTDMKLKKAIQRGDNLQYYLSNRVGPWESNPAIEGKMCDNTSQNRN